MKRISITDAASRLALSVRRVQGLISRGEIKADESTSPTTLILNDVLELRNKLGQQNQDSAANTIRNLWGKTPVRDAKHDLRVMILPEDCKKATRKDPACCVFAQACLRSFGAPRAIFFRTVAYVEIPDESGKMWAERFVLPPEMRSLVEAFDRGEEIIPKAGFLLSAPRGQKRSEVQHAKRKRIREAAAERRKRAMVLGTSLPAVNPKGKYPDAIIDIDLRVRNGTGAVHFTPKSKVKS
jgi:hypothetical protein